jgi:hypothetical protein
MIRNIRDVKSVDALWNTKLSYHSQHAHSENGVDKYFKRGFTMASLTGKASTGESNWEKYVKNNARYKITSYTLETDAKLLALGKKKIDEIADLKKGTSIKITSADLQVLSGKEYASISAGSKKGYVALNQIRKPTGITTASKDTGVDFGLLATYQKNGLAGKYTLNSPSPTESGERDFINEVNSKIKKPITLIIDNKRFANVVGVNKVAGTPKADLVFVSYSEGSKSFREVCYVSHKKGSTYKDFGQWSGISPSAGESIFNHPLTQKFIADVQSHADATFNNKKISATFTIVKEIEGKDSEALKMRSMYGPNYGSKSKSQDNIDFLLQGNPSLVKVGSSGDTFKLNMSGSIHKNGDKMNGGFVAAFMAYRKGSTGDRSQFGVNGGRFVIQPVGGRRADFIIDQKGRLVKNAKEIKKND